MFKKIDISTLKEGDKIYNTSGAYLIVTEVKKECIIGGWGDGVFYCYSQQECDRQVKENGWHL